MLATLATALLALASPLIGLEYDGDESGDRRTSSPTIVHPRTLHPVEDAPKLPRTATNVELSPDGDRVVAIDDGDLVLASTRTGRYLGRFGIGGIFSEAIGRPVLSWIAPNRLLVVDRRTVLDACPERCWPNCPAGCWTTRVRVVDPTARRVVGGPSYFDGNFRTARIAGRQLLLVHPYIGPEIAPVPGTPLVLVLDADGEVVHRTELTELSHVNDLDHDLIVGLERGARHDSVLRFDVRSGTVTARRTFVREGSPSRPKVAGWLLPGPRAAALLSCLCPGYGALDRTTLAAEGSAPASEYRRVAATTPSGYLTVDESEQRPRTRDRLTAYSADGRRQWRRQIYENVHIAAIGRYVYVDHQHDGGRYFMDVIRLRDGRRTAHVPGRRALSAVEAGLSEEQVRRLRSADPGR